jgi:hypothetical protein
MVAWANDCPLLPDARRRHVLALEAAALACAQLAFVLSTRDVYRRASGTASDAFVDEIGREGAGGTAGLAILITGKKLG